MTKPLVRIHNTQTDEVIDKEMTAAQYTQYQKDAKDWEALLVEAETKTAQRFALLERLGITEDEAKLLLA
jgi:hypothetical protein